MEKLRSKFQNLLPDPNDLGRLLSKFKSATFEKSEFLIRPGDVARKLFFIEQGSVVLGSELHDKSVARHLVTENEFITCLESFSKQQSTQEFLKASECTVTYYVTRSDFDQAMDAFPAIEKFYNQLVFDTLLSCQQRITDLTSLNASDYYTNILEKHPDHIQKMPQYDLASFMGIKPQSLSRLRKTRK
ncbi:Crp/Fnr family transcriptional regulator [Dyadobacter crusticola]|uniref:Crp/Fnr family transcriptional regulator n=1 Tax=Dyadobacter crusticola TaxID=292407 RepID=UPI0004E14285|nr:Crp/Fnr family transcriptional regulator [Dyadobacter crusticola]